MSVISGDKVYTILQPPSRANKRKQSFEDFLDVYDMDSNMVEVWYGGCVTECKPNKIMKPNESLEQFILSGGQVGGNQAKSQVNPSSPASEALQLILADPNFDSKSIMFDLSKMLHENPNLASMATGQQRVIVSSPGYNAPNQLGQPAQSNHGIDIPKRQILQDEAYSILSNASGPSQATAGSSYGVSPRPLSPILWDPSQVEIKEEEAGPGLQMSGGTSQVSGYGVYFSNPEPTLAQLNSPPNEGQQEMVSLRNLEDLDAISLDLDTLLTSDILFNTSQLNEIKVEPGIGFGFQWGRESNLSSSVPVSVISNSAEYQELSNLSNGGPAISPTRLTLSPAAGQGMSPSRSALSPPLRHNLSPPSRHNLSPHSQPLSPQMQGGGSMSFVQRSSHNSALHELLARQDPLCPDPIRPRSNSNQFKSAKRPIAARQRNSLSISSPLLASQLSKSAPVKTLPIEQMIWSRRDPRPHMNSVCSNAGDSSIADEVSEIMNGSSPSELNDIDSEDENTNNELETDEDLRIDEDGEEILGGSGKKERHFWQYNVQAKGPKGQKLTLDTKIEDPHELLEVIDPVFSDSVQVHGIKHSGKARRGDGNDLTANPKKLAAIGKELDKINKEINTLTPVSEVPFSTRTKSRKEKNKLASRACRLKKKAQHEANKLKLHGLDEEHNDLMRSLQQVKGLLDAKWRGVAANGVPRDDITQEADRILKRVGRNRVAGQTTDYVNRMITKYS